MVVKAWLNSAKDFKPFFSLLLIKKKTKILQVFENLHLHVVSNFPG